MEIENVENPRTNSDFFKDLQNISKKSVDTLVNKQKNVTNKSKSNLLKKAIKQRKKKMELRDKMFEDESNEKLQEFVKLFNDERYELADNIPAIISEPTEEKLRNALQNEN